MIFIKKYKQTWLMALSAVIIVAFFMSWFSMNPDFKMFAASKTSYSAFNVVRGIGAAAPTVVLLGKAYNFKYTAMLIYLGYALWLIPLLGIASMVLSGMRKKYASLIHVIHFAFSLFIVLIILILVNMGGDMRQLFSSMFRFGLGYYLTLLASALGLGLIIAEKRYKN